MTVKPNAHRPRGREWRHFPGVEKERRRESRQPVLVPIVCLGCARDLAEVVPGTEAFCPHCRRWTSTYDTITEGALTS